MIEMQNTQINKVDNIINMFGDIHNSVVVTDNKELQKTHTNIDKADQVLRNSNVLDLTR